MEELTKTEKLEAIAKIKANPFEFLKYVKIQEPGELRVDYILWSHLIEFYRALHLHKFLIAVKAKQIGISWGLAIDKLREIMTIPGWSVLEISKGLSESQDLLGKSRIVYQNLPEWMKEIPEWRKPLPDSTEQFGFDRLGSVIQAFPSTETAGIGKTAGSVVHDEADFHEFFKTNLGHTMATVADAPERRLVVVSTADKEKPDSDFKKLYKGAVGSGFTEAGSNPFHALFFPYNVRPNRNKEWLDAQPGEDWQKEGNYPKTVEEALSPLSKLSCFNTDILQDLWDNAFTEFETRQEIIHIFHPPQVGTVYMAGIDVGEGVGLDYSVLSIVGKRGLSAEVAAVIYSNKIGTDSFAFESDKLCRTYYNPLLVVDNIGVGRAVADKLVQLGYPNLYYQDKDNRKVGFTLTKPNKRELASKLVELINNKSLITRWKPQIKELMEYQWVNGYPEPTGKTHGDTIIPLLFYAMVHDSISPPEKARFFVDGKRIW